MAGDTRGCRRGTWCGCAAPGAPSVRRAARRCRNGGWPDHSRECVYRGGDDRPAGRHGHPGRAAHLRPGGSCGGRRRGRYAAAADLAAHLWAGPRWHAADAGESDGGHRPAAEGTGLDRCRRPDLAQLRRPGVDRAAARARCAQRPGGAGDARRAGQTGRCGGRDGWPGAARPRWPASTIRWAGCATLDRMRSARLLLT